MRSFISLLLCLPLMALAAEPAPVPSEPQFPQQHSAADLLRLCSGSRLTSSGRERRRYCAGFVSGVEETLRLTLQADSSRPHMCTPANVSATTLAEAYISYAARHQDLLDDPAAAVVQQSLMHTYPCATE